MKYKFGCEVRELGAGIMAEVTQELEGVSLWWKEMEAIDLSVVPGV